MKVLDERPIWSMSGEEKLTALDQLAVELARLETYRLHLIAALDQDGYAAEIGAHDTAQLIEFRHRLDRAQARRDVRLAQALAKYPAVSAALPATDPLVDPDDDPSEATGATDDGTAQVALRPAQAEVIVSALERVPTTVALEDLAVAERELVGLARHLSPSELRRAGQRVRDVLDTDGPEPEEHKAYAREALTLTTADRGVKFRGYLANENAELLRAIVHAGARPHKTVDGELDPRPRDKRQADALTSALTIAATSLDAGLSTTPTSRPTKTPTPTTSVTNSSTPGTTDSPARQADDSPAPNAGGPPTAQVGGTPASDANTPAQQVDRPPASDASGSAARQAGISTTSDTDGSPARQDGSSPAGPDGGTPALRAGSSYARPDCNSPASESGGSAAGRDGGTSARDTASSPAREDGGTPDPDGRASSARESCGAVGGDVPGFGAKATITVTIDLQDLRSAAADAIGDAVYGDGLSAATIRRLACDARIIPLVLGSNSEPLDVGRSERLVTKALRRALNARDKGCVVCGAPPIMCDAHHLLSWIDGGETKISNLALLCRRHHIDLHAGDWTITIFNGTVQVARPTWADPLPGHHTQLAPPGTPPPTHDPSPNKLASDGAPARPSPLAAVLKSTIHSNQRPVQRRAAGSGSDHTDVSRSANASLSTRPPVPANAYGTASADGSAGASGSPHPTGAANATGPTTALPGLTHRPISAASATNSTNPSMSTNAAEAANASRSTISAESATGSTNPSRSTNAIGAANPSSAANATELTEVTSRPILRGGGFVRRLLTAQGADGETADADELRDAVARAIWGEAIPAPKHRRTRGATTNDAHAHDPWADPEATTAEAAG